MELGGAGLANVKPPRPISSPARPQNRPRAPASRNPSPSADPALFAARPNPHLKTPHPDTHTVAPPPAGAISAGVRWSRDGRRESLSTVVPAAAWLAINGCALGVSTCRRVSLDRRLDALAVPAYARRFVTGVGGTG